MLIRTDENQIRAERPVVQAPSTEGAKWAGFIFQRLMGAGLEHGFRYPDLLLGDPIAPDEFDGVVPDFGQWHRTGKIGFKITTIGMLGGHKVYGGDIAVGVLNNHDGRALFRALGYSQFQVDILMADRVIHALCEVTG